MGIKNSVKQQLYKLIRHLSNRIRMNWFEILNDRMVVLKSEWIAGKFSKAGKGVFFRQVSNIVGPQYIRIGEHTGFGLNLWLTAWNLGEGGGK